MRWITIMTILIVTIVMLKIFSTLNKYQDNNSDNNSEKQESFPGQLVEPSGEWPIIAESSLDYEIELLRGKLLSEEIPAIAEIEHRSSVKGAITLLKNRLRVKPEYVSRARKIIEEAGLEKHLIE